jgi:hypothetical protein
LEVDIQQGDFKILWLLPEILIPFLLEKWISPIVPETVEFVKKTQGILGVYVNANKFNDKNKNK